MKKDWLSVIIPAYNPEIWLRRILDSLTEQMKDYPNTEIIVVDDGSTNDVEWLKNYPGIKYRRKRNGGEAAARETGLSMAKGEYISFIDCDDEINPEYLAIVFGNMREGYDWVAYDWTCDGHKEWALQNVGKLMLNCAVWAYSYRRDFIGDTKFDTSLRTGCDIEWLGRLLTEDSKHKHDERILINYRWAGNDNSMCHRKLRGEPV